jgi:hypothetical protein
MGFRQEIIAKHILKANANASVVHGLRHGVIIERVIPYIVECKIRIGLIQDIVAVEKYFHKFILV